MRVRPHLRRIIELFILNNPMTLCAPWDGAAGFSASAIANRFGCSAAWVRMIRLEMARSGRITLAERIPSKGPHGRGTGPRLNGKRALRQHPPPVKRERVQAFLRQGPVGLNAITNGTLAQILGCSKTIAQRVRRAESVGGA
jgi:hypothetical protein